MIYFDNSATSPIAQEVFEAMRPYLQEEYGNPSSKYYLLAAHAADAVENSRNWVAKLIHAKPEEIVFTCGSTESSNMYRFPFRNNEMFKCVRVFIGNIT